MNGTLTDRQSAPAPTPQDRRDRLIAYVFLLVAGVATAVVLATILVPWDALADAALPPRLQAPASGNGIGWTRAPQHGVITLGVLGLCVTRSSTLTIKNVTPSSGASGLQVVGFATQPMPRISTGLGPGTLQQNHFPVRRTVDSLCHSQTPTELGIALRLTGSAAAQTNGFDVSYTSNHVPFTLHVPIDLSLSSAGHSQN